MEASGWEEIKMPEINFRLVRMSSFESDFIPDTLLEWTLTDGSCLMSESSG
jgi:hypothetical protein